MNMVPPMARATLLGLEADAVQQAIDALGLEPEIRFTLTPQNGTLHIHCAGQNAHGSTPEEGHNAQTALVTLLCALPLADCPSTQAIHNLNRLFPHGDFTGQALGIAQRDERSGHLSLAFTLLNLNETGFEARFDSRTPLCGTEV